MRPSEFLRLARLRPRPTPPHSYDDFRRLARRRLPRLVYDFVEGGADGEVTLRANHEAFDRVHFSARSLVDVTDRDPGVTVLGRRLEVPFICGPAGLARLVHREGELAVARATAAAGTVFVISTASSYSIEEIAAVSDGPLWFQLYLWRSPEVVAQLVDRAAAAGCEALVLTVDVPLIGKRERDLRNGMMVPPRIGPAQALEAIRRPHWLWHLAAGPPIHMGSLLELAPPNTDMAGMAAYLDRELTDLAKTWDDVAWLRERWDGPLLIKGVISAANARRCVEQGADAVVVSNHGGRQLDGLPAALDALGEVVAEVGGEAEVMLDGGVRRGADLVKARALGATAAMGGRAWFWALAAAGEAGVARMLELLRDDVDRTLALLGRTAYEDLDAEVLHWPPPPAASRPEWRSGRGRP